MFRELARKKQKLSTSECWDILSGEVRGVLALNGDDGYPYALPINFYPDREGNRIYFHSAMVGYKIDAIDKSDKACFCVCDKGYQEYGHWSLNVKSVIAFGRITKVTDWPDQLMVEFSKRFTDDMQYIQGEIERFKAVTAILCLEIQHMTGKLVNQS